MAGDIILGIQQEAGLPGLPYPVLFYNINRYTIRTHLEISGQPTITNAGTDGNEEGIKEKKVIDVSQKYGSLLHQIKEKPPSARVIRVELVGFTLHIKLSMITVGLLIVSIIIRC